jgi:thymidylate synthase (FAD)
LDPLFRVKVLHASERPNTAAWYGMHQDYSEKFVADEEPPTEERAGEIIVNRLLKGNRGHYGCLEHVFIQFAVGYFPHSVMQQARTHRVGISFDCQSMRYTGQRIVAAANGTIDLEEVFYLRQPGEYSDRSGKKYQYTEKNREADKLVCMTAAVRYASLLERGFAEEHARGILPFDYRQHFVVSFNTRSFMHFLDLRAKFDAQDEIRWLCDLMFPCFESWMPQVAAWYKKNRYAKAILSP